ncbi:MAG: hypothetical protein V2I25_15005 [Woeseiaceae bacterium]|jgi:tetratricopeptide (TPR) repeat protein|nr:hypothetical protein [Woeseiaceae bacterium]
MNKFIRELRRREVFRTAGLYVGICWILIEVASVLLPAFGGPVWLVRGAIIAAVVGFPIMLILAWFFDASAKGIEVQADATGAASSPQGVQKTDFAIIGLLVLALLVSISLNVRNQANDADTLIPDTVSVLIVDFDAGVDTPSFGQAIEQALSVNLETSPSITTSERLRAEQIGRIPGTTAKTFDLESALRVARQHSIDVLLAGSIQTAGSGYVFAVEGIDPATSRSAFTVEQKADSENGVLPAIGKLAGRVKKAMDVSATAERPAGQAGVFEAASLEAARTWAAGRAFELAGELEQAASDYAAAVELDPGLGRGWTRLALVEYALGQADEAAMHWSKALPLLGTLTERERLEALARYAELGDVDNVLAAKAYADLIAHYPADVEARDRYAAVSLSLLDFDTAVEQMRESLKVFPEDRGRRTRLAMYTIWQGDWDTARKEAERVIAADPDYGTAYLPLAMADLAVADFDAARDTYRRMAAAAETAAGASVSALGLADVDLYTGRIVAARERLANAIRADINAGNDEAAALKTVALAQSYADANDRPAAIAAAADALQLADGVAVRVPAAMVYLDAAETAAARAIADELLLEKDAHSRAYGQMLAGLARETEGDRTGAILALRRAIDTADLWLIRLQIGKAYLRAGSYPEALGEFTALQVRRGEAASLFLDDMPTYRWLAELPYWHGRVQEALSTRSAAQSSYAQFLALRPEGGPLANDAAERLAALD